MGSIFFFSLICTLIVSYTASPHKNEFVFDRIELLNSTYFEGLYNVSEFRITKYNRTLYVLNAKVEFLNDVAKDHTMEVSFYYNRLNNNQYIKSMVNVPKDELCNIVDKHYKILFGSNAQEYTNLPQKKEGGKFGPILKVS